MRQRDLLDDVQIRHWISKGEPVAKSDGDGLTFTLSATGTASWILRYRNAASRRREVTLGNYPDLTLAEARKLARKRRVDVDKGRDPAAEKKLEKMRAHQAWTVRKLAEDYKAKKLTIPPLSEGTMSYRRWDIDKVIVPKLGSIEVRQVVPADIVHVLETSKRSWTVCKRILTSSKKLFGHACGKRLIDYNPCAGIELVALMRARPPVRKRVMLTEDELRTLLKGVDDIGLANALALRILLATCVRSIELTKARWEHVDLERGTWWVPEESVKTRVGFLVPLTPTVATWFRQLRDLSEGSAWVLPARTARRVRRLGDTHVGKTTLWAAAIMRAFEREKIDIRKFTPHDTRSTAKGHMRNMGVANEITELALNHKLKGMEAVTTFGRRSPSDVPPWSYGPASSPPARLGRLGMWHPCAASWPEPRSRKSDRPPSPRGASTIQRRAEGGVSLSGCCRVQSPAAMPSLRHQTIRSAFMPTATTSQPPRTLTPAEVAAVVKMFRESRRWSQEQLAEISRLSTRTVQRVENGDPSDLNTRRALARAFEVEDIDFLNKPFSIPTREELEAARQAFDREHITLDAHPLTTRRQLAGLAETHSLDLCTPGFDLERQPAESFAALVDYLHEYRDCADLYGEVQKLDIYDELQAHIDALAGAGVSLRYATRKVRLGSRENAEAQPFEASVVYVVTYPAGKEPAQFATPRKFKLG